MRGHAVGSMDLWIYGAVGLWTCGSINTHVGLTGLGSCPLLISIATTPAEKTSAFGPFASSASRISGAMSVTQVAEQPHGQLGVLTIQ